MIVLVDDNKDDRDIVAAALAAADSQVRTAGFSAAAPLDCCGPTR
jgi:hypothetical protein